MCLSLNETMTPYALKWSQMFASLAATNGLMILKAKETSCKKNADASPTSKTVVYYIYSINSLIGKFGANDVNTAGTFSI